MRQYEHAAQTLTLWMQQRGITAVELSRQLEIDAGILRAILAGKQKNISTRNMLSLARYFGLSLQELIDKLA